jgi:hypothetical protein
MPCTWTAGQQYVNCYSLFINFSRCVTNTWNGPASYLALIVQIMYSDQVAYTELLEAELFYSLICAPRLLNLFYKNNKLTNF